MPIDEHEKEKEVVRLAYETRLAQKAYFADRIHEKLATARAAERTLDRALYDLGYRFRPDRDEPELPL